MSERAPEEITKANIELAKCDDEIMQLRKKISDLQQHQTVVMGFKQGLEIEAAYKDGVPLKWHSVECPTWNRGSAFWRLKPAPQIVPWCLETLPSLPFEVRHPDGTRNAVVSASEESVKLGSGSNMSYAHLLSHYTLPDGSRCGTPSP